MSTLTTSPSLRKKRYLDDRARLERRGLRPALGGVAADAGIGAGDRELDEVGELDRRRRAGNVENVHLGVLPQVLPRLADLVGRQRELLVRLGVHEVVAVVLVEELHVLFFEVDKLDLLARSERVVDDLAELHVLELRPSNQRAALARLHVLKVDDRVGVAVEDDPEPLLNSAVDTCIEPSLSVFDARGAQSRAGPAPLDDPDSFGGSGQRSAPPPRRIPARGRAHQR